MNHFKEICNKEGCYELVKRSDLFCSMHNNSAPFVQSPVDSGISMYTTEGKAEVVVLFDANNEVWLSQKEIAELYGKTRETITEHVNNILKLGEFDDKKVAQKFLITSQHNKSASGTQTKEVMHYNLDMIFVVGMRVHSPEAKAFRQWVLSHLTAVTQVGYSISNSISDRRINEMAALATELRDQGKKEFRNINAAIVQCSDYNTKNSSAVFSEIKDSIIYTLTKLTSRELIVDRLNPDHKNCGLNPGLKVNMVNAKIALNYLTKDEHERYIKLLVAINEAVWVSAVSLDTVQTVQDVLSACLSVTSKPPRKKSTVTSLGLVSIICARIEKYNPKNI